MDGNGQRIGGNMPGTAPGHPVVALPSLDVLRALPPRLRLAEAAWYTGLSPKSLGDRGWRRRHGVPAIKVGRAVLFDRAALDTWLARRRERPPAQADSPPGP